MFSGRGCYYRALATYVGLYLYKGMAVIGSKYGNENERKHMQCNATRYRRRPCEVEHEMLLVKTTMMTD